MSPTSDCLTASPQERAAGPSRALRLWELSAHKVGNGRRCRGLWGALREQGPHWAQRHGHAGAVGGSSVCARPERGSEPYQDIELVPWVFWSQRT